MTSPKRAEGPSRSSGTRKPAMVRASRRSSTRSPSSERRTRWRRSCPRSPTPVLGISSSPCATRTRCTGPNASCTRSCRRGTVPIHDVVDQGATNWPERPAVVFEECTITFAELAHESARVASGLRALTEPGDRVAILARNIPEYVECQYGVPRAGLVLTLLNYRLHPREWAWILTNAGARVLLVQHDLLPAIEPLLAEVESLERVVVIGGDASASVLRYEALKSTGRSDTPPQSMDESTPAYLIYTSGTTGFPKGALISHRGARMAAVTNALESELRAD